MLGFVGSDFTRPRGSATLIMSIMEWTPTLAHSSMNFSMVGREARPETVTASAVASDAIRASRWPVSRVFRSQITKVSGRIW